MPDAPGLFLRTLNQPAQRGDRLPAVRFDGIRIAERPGTRAETGIVQRRPLGHLRGSPCKWALSPPTRHLGADPDDCRRRPPPGDCSQGTRQVRTPRLWRSSTSSGRHARRRISAPISTPQTSSETGISSLTGCPMSLTKRSVQACPKRRLDDVRDLPENPGPAPEPECVTSIRRYFRVGGESAASAIGPDEYGPSSPERRPCALRGTGCRPTPKRHGVQGGPGPARGAIRVSGRLAHPTPSSVALVPLQGRDLGDQVIRDRFGQWEPRL